MLTIDAIEMIWEYAKPYYNKHLVKSADLESSSTNMYSTKMVQHTEKKKIEEWYEREKIKKKFQNLLLTSITEKVLVMMILV